MLRELTAEDFAHGVKNPYFEKFMKKTEIAVEREAYDVFCEIGRMNGVTAEKIMSRRLSSYAKKLKEHD